MKRLLIVTELFSPSIGGMESRYQQLGGLCVQNGWSVDVLTVGIDNSPAAQVIDGMNVSRLIYKTDYQRPSSRIPRDPKTMWAFAVKVRRHLLMQTYDAVVFSIWPLIPQIISRIPKHTVAVVDWCEHRGGGAWWAINTVLSKSTQKHICVSDSLKRRLAKRYLIKDIESIPTGIFAPNYKVSPKKSGVLFLGRLSLHKRPEEAILAVIAAREQGFDEHLTIAGGGPLLAELRDKYSGLNFIKILGAVSEEEKVRLFSEHRLYILPSIREGFPVSVAEAMASGTPVITTDHPNNGTADIVKHYNAGVVVEPSTASLAAAVLRLTQNVDEWGQYHRSCVAAGAELDWQLVYQKFVNHLGLRN